MRVSVSCIHAALLVALVATLGACRPAPTERELLVQATLYAEQGEHAAAEQAFAEALQAGGGSAELFSRYAAFRLDAGNLDGAAQLLDQADRFEMTQAERRRLDDERARWLRLNIERLEATQTPESDPTELLSAYERLAALEPTGESAQRWAATIVREVRLALGCDPAAACVAAEIDTQRLAATDAARALRLARIPDASTDPRPTFSDGERNELRAVAALLDRTVFETAFTSTFESQRSARLAAEGRWDATARVFSLRYIGPFAEGQRADTRPELLLASAQSVLARRVVTSLAWELRGQAAPDDLDLPLSPRDLSGVLASDLAVTPQGEFTFQLRVPWAVALRAAWMLEQRLSRNAAEPAGP